jgi:hypothetical protein
MYFTLELRGKEKKGKDILSKLNSILSCFQKCSQDSVRGIVTTKVVGVSL